MTIKIYRCLLCRKFVTSDQFETHRADHVVTPTFVTIVEMRAELMSVDELPMYDLSEHVDEFDYITGDDRMSSPRLFAHNGSVYDTGEFMPVTSDVFKDWDGYHADTFFSALLVKFLGWDETNPASDPSDEGFVRVGLALS